MKTSLKIIAISILVLFLFRGFLYRLVIKYKDIGTRTEVKIIEKNLIKKIESKSIHKEIDFDKIIAIANEITIEELNFTTSRASSNPNDLINSKQANCVGYSAMFNSIANYIIRKNKLENKIEAKHQVGKLHLFGIDIHHFFDSSFFRDHDFNEIKNIETGEVISVDPSVSDYFWINRITKG